MKSTITKDTESTLANIINGGQATTTDKYGRHFIDCDPDIFSCILDFLRFGLHPPQKKLLQVYEYAKYFSIHEIVKTLEQYQCVQSKTHKDAANSKLNAALYEKLKQEAVTQLSRLNPHQNKCLRITEATKKINPFSNACRFGEQALLGYIYESEAQTSKALAVDCQLRLTTNIPLANDALGICLASDLRQLGYGALSAYRNDQVNCNHCRISATCLSVLLLTSSTAKEVQNVRNTKPGANILLNWRTP